MFKTMIVENFVKPMAVRVGTVVSGYLVGLSVHSEHADAIGVGVASLLLVGCDLMLSYMRRRSIVNDTVNKVMDGERP